MQTVNDAIAHSLTMSQALLTRYTADLTPSEYLHRPCAKANCAAWIVGHLILSERRALGLLGVTDTPALPAGFEQRFARDESAPAASEYGDVSVLMPLFNQQRDRLIAAVRAAALGVLDKPLEKPHPLFGTVGEMVNFMGQHVTMHAGQITLIRRSLGRPPLA